MANSEQNYNLRGVSASKEEVHKAIASIDKGLYPQAFCKIIPDYLGGNDEYCCVMHADVPEQNLHWLMFIGKKRAICRCGKELHKMQ